jgi:hypothetical protein
MPSIKKQKRCAHVNATNPSFSFDIATVTAKKPIVVTFTKAVMSIR